MSEADKQVRAFPLCWPDGWKRIPSHQRSEGRFLTHGRAPSIADGVGRVMAELGRLGIKRDDLIVSTDVETRLDGLPRSDRANPSDPGAAVYWRKDQNHAMKCMAIDRYRAVADNLCAIAATLEAMRAIERHGGAEILERAFRGFQALPASTSRPWRDVLGLNAFTHSLPTIGAIESAWRNLAKEAHPDRGGSHEAMAELNAARAAALEEIGA